jgi:hypothetical protein
MRISLSLRRLLVAAAAAWPLAASAAVVERAAPATPAGVPPLSAPVFTGTISATTALPAVPSALLSETAEPARPALKPSDLPSARNPQPAAAADAPTPAAATDAASAHSNADARATPPDESETLRAEEKRQAALRYAQRILDGLIKQAAELPDNSYARTTPPEELGRMARTIMQQDDAFRPLRAVAAALGGDERAYRKMVQEFAPPRMLNSTLYTLSAGLRRAFEADLPAGPRVEISHLLHSLAADFLTRLQHEPSLPESVRDVAANAVPYIEDDRMLAAIAWGRQEKARVAEARSAVLAERVEDERGKIQGTSAFDPSGGWHPPAPDSVPPAQAGQGVFKRSNTLDALERAFRDNRARFELARARRDVAARRRLSKAGTARETRRWKKAVRVYALFLDGHENTVNRVLNNSVPRSFGRINIRGRPVREPTNPNLHLREVDGGYRLEASFETKIDDPAVIAAVHRSIESYWKGSFEEDGRVKTFEARIDVRVLAPEEAYSENALRLIVSEKTNSYAGADTIALSRTFRFRVPAHEFGHILGLPDEYVDEYAPEAMELRYEQDRSSAMANDNGLFLPRHYAQVVQLLKAAGRLGR